MPSILHLVALCDGLTFDEYLEMLRKHPKPRLLGPLRIHMRRVLGVQTWRVAPLHADGAEPRFCLELDRPARLIAMTAEDLDAAMNDTGAAAEDARGPRWATPPRASRRPALRADRDRGPDMSIEDFRTILRQRPDFLAEAVALAADGAMHAEQAAAQEERAALAQEARNRTPAQRALVAAFNRRAAAARAADKRRND